MIEIDAQGTWQVDQLAACNLRLLLDPSQSFLDWQAALPVIDTSQEEADLFRTLELLAIGHSTIPVPLLSELVTLLARRLGFG